MKRTVTVGKKYRHFKGIVVEVTAIAKDCEDLHEVVVYKHNGDYWVRSLSDFLSEVDHTKYPNAFQKYRFEEISE